MSRELFEAWWERTANSAQGCNEFPGNREKSSAWNIWSAALPVGREQGLREAAEVCEQLNIVIAAATMKEASAMSEAYVKAANAIRALLEAK